MLFMLEFGPRERLPLEKSRTAVQFQGGVLRHRALVVNDRLEIGEEPAKLRGAEVARMPTHDVGHDRVGSFHLPASSRSRHDQLGSTVGRIRFAFDVTQGLKVVDYCPNDLLELPGQAGEVCRSDTVRAKIGQHCSMTRNDVVKPLIMQTIEEFALHGEDEPTGQHA